MMVTGTLKSALSLWRKKGLIALAIASKNKLAEPFQYRISEIGETSTPIWLQSSDYRLHTDNSENYFLAQKDTERSLTIDSENVTQIEYSDS